MHLSLMHLRLFLTIQKENQIIMYSISSEGKYVVAERFIRNGYFDV